MGFVFDDETKAEPKLNAVHNGHGHEPLNQGYQVGGRQKKHAARDKEASTLDFAIREFVENSNCTDGVHGLDGNGDVKKERSTHIEQPVEEERRREVGTPW